MTMNLRTPTIILASFAGSLIIGGAIMACFNPWSSSICSDHGAECLWVQELPGSISDQPDTASQENQCLNGSGGDLGALTFVSSSSGETWLYTCCLIPGEGEEPEIPQT